VNPWLLVALLFVPSRTPNSFRTSLRAFGRTEAENAQLNGVPGTLARRPRCIRVERDLANSSRSQATGVRNQTHLLVVGRRQWPRRLIKNTQRRRAGNLGMTDARRGGFGERDNTATFV